ncbi:hypothetical protein OIO90_001619 [Microbotryomycetes sp. JL221]|nr:hypothetical protein OIO90_001619 [Microbotryomycetes sp. JL221]
MVAGLPAEEAIHVHSVPDFAMVKSLHGHKAGVSQVAFDPSSRYIASASEDRSIRIWDVLATHDDKPIRTLNGHASPVFCVNWSPRGNMVASGGLDESVRIWNVHAEECLRVLPAHSDPVSSVTFTGDGAVLVTSSWDGYIRVWDTATGQCLKTLMEEDSTPISNICFSPNEAFLFTSALDSTIRIWNHQSGKTLKTYAGHLNRKYCIPVVLDLEKKLVITGSEDHDIVLWDIQTREVVARLKGHSDAVIALDSHPKLPLLASGALDKVRSKS